MTEKNKKLSLTSKIFVSLISGMVFGIILSKLSPSVWRDDYLINGLLEIVGSGFIRLMQMLVVPLVFASLVTGAMSMGDTNDLGKVGIKTVVFYIITTAMAIAIAISLASLINPGKGMDLTAVEMAEIDYEAMEAASVSMKDTLLGIIPTNPMDSLASGNMLQIIFFAIALGIIIAKIGDRASNIANIMNELNEIMMSMTMAVMSLAPLGVFALISRTFSQLGFSAITQMISYMGTVLLSLGVHLILVYMVLLVVFARVNPFIFLRKFLPVMTFAFTTASSNASIPLTIDKMTDMGVDRRISSFTIPLGATINMDGTAIMQGVAVVFVANAYGISLGFNEYLTVILAATLASIGTAGIPSVGLITLSMVFKSVGLPVEGIAMIMGIDRLLDMARTAVNVTGDATVTTIISRQSGLLDLNKYYE